MGEGRKDGAVSTARTFHLTGDALPTVATPPLHRDAFHYVARFIARRAIHCAGARRHRVELDAEEALRRGRDSGELLSLLAECEVPR